MKTLYKKNKNGSIQSWGIIATDNGYKIGFGRLGGKTQIAFTSIDEGKQSRNQQEQIEFEIQSQIRGKKDSGYKSLEDLGVVDSVSENGMSLDLVLQELLPEDTTDSSGNIKPMLAQPIKNDKKDNWNKVKYPIAGEPKLDGVRCLISLKECQGGIEVTDIQSLSREGKSYDFGTTKIRESLVPLFIDFPNIILDGELYIHGKPQNQISGSMRSGKYIPEVHDSMEYHVYDVIDLTDKDKSYQDRRQFLIDTFMKYEGFILGFMKTLNNREEVNAYEAEQIEKGYEGIMLKNLDGKYEIGKRSYNNLKVKQFLDEEFEVVGYELGKRGAQDLVFVCKTKEGKEFKPTATGTVAEKEQYVKDLEADLHEVEKNRKIIGKHATVKFKFWSEFGIPNHCQVLRIRNYE